MRILKVVDPFVVCIDDTSQEIRIGKDGSEPRVVYVTRQHGIAHPLYEDISDMSLTECPPDSEDSIEASGRKHIRLPSEQFALDIYKTLDSLDPNGFSDAKSDVVEFLKTFYDKRLEDADTQAEMLGRALDIFTIHYYAVPHYCYITSEAGEQPTVAGAIEYCFKETNFLSRDEIEEDIKKNCRSHFVKELGWPEKDE